MLVLSLLSHSYEFETPAYGIVPPTLRMDLSSKLGLFSKDFHSHMQGCIFRVVLNPIKMITKSNHHVSFYRDGSHSLEKLRD